MEDGYEYPTDELLEEIRAFDVLELGWRAFMDRVRALWWAADWGWREVDALDEFIVGKKVRRFQISTGGWSGNESLINAMHRNTMFWMIYWVQSRRGGHYVFECYDLERK